VADVQVLRGYAEELNSIIYGINNQRALIRELNHYDETGLTDKATDLLVRISGDLSATMIDIVDLIVVLNNAVPVKEATPVTRLRKAMGI
jgi:hypothetical protein